MKTNIIIPSGIKNETERISKVLYKVKKEQLTI